MAVVSVSAVTLVPGNSAAPPTAFTADSTVKVCSTLKTPSTAPRRTSPRRPGRPGRPQSRQTTALPIIAVAYTLAR